MAGEMGQYFVRRRGRIMGPFDLTQLERMLRRGNVNRRDACSTGRRNWTPLEDQQIAGLIMWAPASAAYLLIALAILYRSMQPAYAR